MIENLLTTMASFRLDVLLLFFMVITKWFNSSSCENSCTNPLPGLLQLASGVDIIALDLFPFGESNSNHGLHENIFNFTCSGAKFKYKDKEAIFYDIPDQMYVQGLDVDFESDYVSFMADVDSVKETLMSRLFLQDGWQSSHGTFSRNPKYTSLLKQIFGLNKTFSQIETVTSTVFSQVNPFEGGTSRVKQGILSRDFLEFVTQKLPPKYEDDPVIYQSFVQRFGTHYFSRAYLSDYNYLVFAFNRDYLFDTEDEQLADNMRAAYFDYFKRWDTINSTNISSDLLFANVSEIALAYSSRQNGSFWEDKVTGKRYSRANQFSGLSIRWTDLQSIAGLIANRTIREQVEIAISAHRTVAQLEELKNMYKFSPSYQLSNEEKVSLENAEKLVLNLNNRTQIAYLSNTNYELYYQLLLAKDRAFYEPVIDDLFVTAGAKLAFAKQICAFSFGRFMRADLTGGLCESAEIRDLQKETSHLYGVIQDLKVFPNNNSVIYSMYQRYFKKARSLRYGLRDDIKNGLRASCGKC